MVEQMIKLLIYYRSLDENQQLKRRGSGAAALTVVARVRKMRCHASPTDDDDVFF